MHTEHLMTSPDTRFSLIGRLQDAGDASAWNEFVHLYQPMIFRIARRRGLQYADAAEVTQEVLSRVSQAIQSWEPDRARGSFRGWLYRITRNLTIDFLRKSRRRLASLDSSHGVSVDQISNPSLEESREFQIEFERQLFLWASTKIQAHFQPHSWQAFWRTAVDGMTVAEVAEELSMTPGAIYVARSRVMKRLSEEVRQRMDESLDRH